MAKSIRGAPDRFNQARMSRPCDRTRRAAFAASLDPLHRLLSWGANASLLGEGRADDSTRADADGRARRRLPGSRRITSSLRTTRGLTCAVARARCAGHLGVCRDGARAGEAPVDFGIAIVTSRTQGSLTTPRGTVTILAKDRVQPLEYRLAIRLLEPLASVVPRGLQVQP